MKIEARLAAGTAAVALPVAPPAATIWIGTHPPKGPASGKQLGTEMDLRTMGTYLLRCYI